MLAKALAALLLTPAVAYAADITEQIIPGKRPAIVIGGEFERYDHKKFVQLALKHDDGKVLVVFRESPGGALETALQIGKAIRLKEFDTTVEEGASCASACAYAWLSGKRRYLEKDARVG
jgi:hypothetical protein